MSTTSKVPIFFRRGLTATDFLHLTDSEFSEYKALWVDAEAVLSLLKTCSLTTSEIRVRMGWKDATRGVIALHRLGGLVEQDPGPCPRYRAAKPKGTDDDR